MIKNYIKKRKCMVCDSRFIYSKTTSAKEFVFACKEDPKHHTISIVLDLVGSTLILKRNVIEEKIRISDGDSVYLLHQGNDPIHHVSTYIQIFNNKEKVSYQEDFDNSAFNFESLDKESLLKKLRLINTFN